MKLQGPAVAGPSCARRWYGHGPPNLHLHTAGQAARNVKLSKDEQLAVKGLGLITIKAGGC
ncbi:hypothetical protein HaLaN_05669 [Haematococcus lacustris]|uniref:Uncharacterized protein n=1 Tax=Haematococcus lacustris TaxID=44745 RepID=A0A699YV72_HAELA|nr:hypothetical protein HaLaN_05669 [Haematococcus lacustris]